MRDVAVLAGVGLATVSRVVNGKPGVAPELADRIAEAARKLGYQHDRTASSLRRADRKTDTIGMVLENVANPFSSAVHRTDHSPATATSADRGGRNDMASGGNTVGTQGDVLTRQELNRATLARQLLLRRAADGVVETIEHLVGMQSQVPNSPYVGLWTRLRDFRPEQLADLMTSQEVVRIALQRSTVHLVSAADCLSVRPVLQPMLERALFRHSAYGPGLDGLDLDALLAVGRDLLDAEPLTPAELRAALGQRWPDRDADTLVIALRNLLPLIQVPPRGVWGQGGQTRYATAQSWLGRPLGTETAPDDLVLRYLRAFGPATVRDVQTWSGLTQLREVLDRLRPRLRVFRGEAGAELFDLPDTPRPDPDTPAPPRFLPEYDNLLAAYADRSRVTTDANRKRLARPNGASPALLVNGEVAGSWRATTESDTATLRVELFSTLSKSDTDAVAAEAHRLLDFLSPATTTHDVQLDEPH